MAITMCTCTCIGHMLFSMSHTWRLLLWISNSSSSQFYVHGFTLSCDYLTYTPHRKHSDEEITSAQIKVLIDQHLSKKEEVEAAIPQAIVIGPFHVNTDTVRMALSKKHKEVSRALLNFLAKTLHKEADQVCSVHVHELDSLLLIRILV